MILLKCVRIGRLGAPDMPRRIRLAYCLALLTSIVAPASAEVVFRYSGDSLPAAAKPPWKLASGTAQESLVDGRWVIGRPADFARGYQFAPARQRRERQTHEVSFRWMSTASDSHAADGVWFTFAGRRLRLFPLRLADGESVLLTGTANGCVLSEPACRVRLPGELGFRADRLNQYRVRWTTNRENDYPFQLAINGKPVGELPGETIGGHNWRIGFEARAGNHELDDIQWSILTTGSPIPDPDAAHARRQLERGRRQLFLDDAIIASREGVSRQLHQPRKFAGNPVLRAADKPWQTFRAQVYGTVLYFPEERLFKMWYLAAPRFPWEEPGKKDGRTVCPNFQFTAYAESKDAVHWRLPSLGLVNYDGSTDNNICKLATECAEGIAVVYDAQATNPDRRYKAFYWEHSVPYQGSPVKTIHGMSVAFSRDGKLWREHPQNPVIDQSSDSGQQAFWDPDRKVFRALGRFGAGGRRVAMSTSKDFSRWSPSRLVIAADAEDGAGVQIYGMGTTFYEGCFIGLPWMYHQGSTEQIDVELAISRDCVNWRRVADRGVFIPNGKPGEWDAGMIFTASQPLQTVGDRIFIYYTGIQGNHVYNIRKLAQPGDGDYEQHRRRGTASIGLATIRRDGFVSMRAGAREGNLVTREFTWPADRQLHVNCDASLVDSGRLEVDVLAPDLKPIIASTTIRGDKSSHRVQFDAKQPSGRRVRLRFRLASADLYSFWFE